MQIPTMRVIVSLALVALVTAVEPEKDGKKSKGLQIGVKKRIDPDKCPVKSKKGDTLHMHYTVSTICMVTSFFSSENCIKSTTYRHNSVGWVTGGLSDM